jgi:hypothetical protein
MEINFKVKNCLTYWTVTNFQKKKIVTREILIWDVVLK